MFAALLSALAAVHAGALTVKSLAYKGEMPYVQSDNARLAQRINHAIYLDMLELPAPVKWQDGLKDNKTEEGVQRTSDLSFDVVRNDDRILALAVSAEGCGAYCEHYTVHFNFDAASGRHVVAADLLTPAGAANVFKRLESQRLARLKAEIAKIRRDAKAAKEKAARSKSEIAEEDEVRFTETLEMYERCAASITDPEMARYRSLANVSMKIGRDAVTFVHERCSIHAMRALDELGETESALSFKELAPHLSDYGRALLIGGSKSAPPAGPFHQVLTGKVGNAPVTVRLGARNSDGSLSGFYFYDKYRTPIRLFGKAAGNTIELTESESKETVLPMIRATINGESLKGQWIGNGRQIAFEAGP